MTSTWDAKQAGHVARFLSHLSVANRPVPVRCAEMLLLIASGVDHISEIRAAMVDHEGRMPDVATINRLMSQLKGRAVPKRGTWVESPFSFVETRKHPHRQGYQLVLSDQGEQLLSTYFPKPDA